MASRSRPTLRRERVRHGGSGRGRVAPPSGRVASSLMDVDTARLLLDRGLEILDDLPEYEEAQALVVGTRLRREGLDPDLVAAVLTQAELRARGRVKFGADADRMLFTRDGLEQATRRDVADHHAARFAAAGLTVVHDLGCGLGADALGLVRAGITARGVDVDEATALLAAHNLATLDDGTGSSAERGRAEDADPVSTEGVWFDPARRTPGRTDATGRTRRTFRLEDMTPPWPLVLATAARIPATGAKLSPAFPARETPHGAQAEWVSHAGDLVECALWWGPLVAHPGRTATLLRPGADPVVVSEDDADGAPPAGSRPVRAGSVLHEPDLAVLQAGLTGALARSVEGAEIAPGMGYVVSDTEVEVPFARRHRVAEVLPANAKGVKAWLRRAGLTGLTIKRRGGRLDPEDLRRRLGLPTRGGDQATLLLTVAANGPVALVLEAVT